MRPHPRLLPEGEGTIQSGEAASSITLLKILLTLLSEEDVELYGFSASGLCRLTGLPSMKFSILVIASS